jgi:hypothetical protein
MCACLRGLVVFDRVAGAIIVLMSRYRDRGEAACRVGGSRRRSAGGVAARRAGMVLLEQKRAPESNACEAASKRGCEGDGTNCYERFRVW